VQRGVNYGLDAVFSAQSVKLAQLVGLVTFKPRAV
jgi:hypothetical protein